MKAIIRYFLNTSYNFRQKNLTYLSLVWALLAIYGFLEAFSLSVYVFSAFLLLIGCVIYILINTQKLFVCYSKYSIKF